MGQHTITFTDAQEKCIANDIVDFDEWLQADADGRANKSKKEILKEWQPKLFADPAVTTFPAVESEFLAAVFARADYKDRAARDAETKAEAEARKAAAEA